jgi:S1-C subfamily serine protease
MRWCAILLLVVAFLLTGCANAVTTTTAAVRTTSTMPPPTTAAASGTTTTEATTTTVTEPSTTSTSVLGQAQLPDLAAKVRPSIVLVQLSGTTASSFPGNTRQQAVSAEFVGLVCSADGFIVTLNPATEGITVSSLTVTLASGKKLPAVVRGEDAASGLAVLRVQANGLSPATFSTAPASPGESVAVVGWKPGTEFSTLMKVTGVDQAIPGVGGSQYAGLITTDSAMPVGSAGSGVFDAGGQVVGVAFASDGQKPIGYAIPADTVLSVATQLIASGHASHAYLGLGLATVTSELQQQHDLSRSSGALVDTVVASSPAGKAGVKQGDIIISLAGKPVIQVGDVFTIIDQHKVGETVPLVVDRGGKSITFQVTLAERPASANG